MSYAHDWVPASKRRSRNVPNQLLSCRTLKTEVQAIRLDRCECAREVGVGEATAHRPVASADGLARRGGHGAVEAVAVGVRSGRFRWPAMKKCGEKKQLGKAARPSFRRVTNFYQVATMLPHSEPDLGWLVPCLPHFVPRKLVGWVPFRRTPPPPHSPAPARRALE